MTIFVMEMRGRTDSHWTPTGVVEFTRSAISAKIERREREERRQRRKFAYAPHYEYRIGVYKRDDADAAPADLETIATAFTPAEQPRDGMARAKRAAPPPVTLRHSDGLKGDRTQHDHARPNRLQRGVNPNFRQHDEGDQRPK
jgi:hypothetical protein